MNTNCEKYVDGSISQCGRRAVYAVFPGTSDGWWAACENHGGHLDGRQGPNGTTTSVRSLDELENI